MDFIKATVLGMINILMRTNQIQHHHCNQCHYYVTTGLCRVSYHLCVMSFPHAWFADSSGRAVSLAAALLSLIT